VTVRKVLVSVLILHPLLPNFLESIKRIKHLRRISPHFVH